MIWMGIPATGIVRSLNDKVKLPTLVFLVMTTSTIALVVWPDWSTPVSRIWAIPFSNKEGSSVPLTADTVPAANCVKIVEPLASYSKVQLERFGLVTVPVTVVGAVTSDPSVGLVMLTIGPG